VERPTAAAAQTASGRTSLVDAERRAHSTEAQLRGHGEYGCEIQLLRDGEFYAGFPYMLRAEAVAMGLALRRDLEKDGWCD
jgi:hypothetical protein